MNKVASIVMLVVTIGLAYALGARHARPAVPTTENLNPSIPSPIEARRSEALGTETRATNQLDDLPAEKPDIEARLVELLKPNDQQGSWRHDDARALENVAAICGRDRRELGQHLLESGRLEKVLECYRLLTPLITDSATALDSARDHLFAHKFRHGDYVEAPLTARPSSPDFRSRFGISEHAVVHSRAVSTDTLALRQVAWIEPEELPMSNSLEAEARHLKRWRRSALLQSIGTIATVEPR